MVRICCPSVVYSNIKYPNGTDLLERYEKRTKEYKTTVRDKTQTSYDIILLSFKDSKDCLSHNICGICRKRKHHDPKKIKLFILFKRWIALSPC